MRAARCIRPLLRFAVPLPGKRGRIKEYLLRHFLAGHADLTVFDTVAVAEDMQQHPGRLAVERMGQRFEAFRRGRDAAERGPERVPGRDLGIEADIDTLRRVKTRDLDRFLQRIVEAQARLPPVPARLTLAR